MAHPEPRPSATTLCRPRPRRKRYEEASEKSSNAAHSRLTSSDRMITNGNGGTIPRWHHYAMLAWTKGPVEIAATENYQSSYRDLAGTVSGALRDVAAYTTVDLQAAYRPMEQVRIAVGARNLLNKDPPYSNVGGQNYFQAGYDPGYADPRGRYMYGSVTYSFAPR